MAKSGVLTEPAAAAKNPPRSLGMWARLTGVLTAEQLQLAYAEWEKSGESPGEVFVRHGWMTEQMVADALGELSGLPVVPKAKRSDDPEVMGALSAEDAWLLEACPIERDDDGNLVVALADPSDARLRALKGQFGSGIRPVIVLNSQLKALLDEVKASGAKSGPEASVVEDDEPEVEATSEAVEEEIEAVIEEETEAVIDDETEAVAEAHDAASDPEVGTSDRAEEAPEPAESATPTFDPIDVPAASNGQIERLYERLASEYAQSADELATYQRRFAEIAEEHARLKRSITALEAKAGEQELLLSLLKAKLES